MACVRSILLKALVLATSAAQVGVLTCLVVHTIYSIDWTDFSYLSRVEEAVRAISLWRNWPVLSEDAVALKHHISSGSGAAAPAVAFCRNAFSFAAFLDRHSEGGSAADDAHASNASSVRMPATPADYTPGGFLRLVKRQRVEPCLFNSFF